MSKHFIVYIPGLGGHNDGLRRFFLRFWRVFGVKIELVTMNWKDGRGYDEKYQRVVEAVERAQKKGYTISLVGESAGASMAMNVFSRLTRIHKLITICGINDSQTPIADYHFVQSPAFKESVSLLDASRESVLKDRADRIISFTALVDNTVPPSKNRILGTKHKTMFSFGHLPTVGLCLSIYSFLIVREIKR